MGFAGTCHGIEIPYVFQAFQFLDNVTADEELSRSISSAWRAFAAQGDPNHAGLPVQWSPFNAKEEYLTFDLAITADVKLKDAKCDLFDKLDPPGADSGSKLLRLQEAFETARFVTV